MRNGRITVIKSRFGKDEYAMEELVAELTSAYICAALGIHGNLRHAEYLSHWIKGIREDKFAFFTASREAQKAAEFILSSGKALKHTADTNLNDTAYKVTR